REWPADEALRSAWLARVGANTGLPAARLAQLLERYGTRAEGLATFLAVETDEALEHVPDYSRRELGWIAQQEAVMHLDDLLLRRTLLAMCGRVTTAGLAEAAATLGGALGWDSARIEEERAQAGQLLRERHGVRL
ncbi:MAG: hypothetical protein OXB89_07520, partial [Anaerolineaceae bacterium]|nr:hypothetical protein [Anaerolineaceae bacterium]